MAACSFPTENGSVEGLDARLDIDGGASPDARPLPDSNDPDPDNDGLQGAADNCPETANTDQFNEDGDARGNACDPCPHLGSAAADADGDGDGVGDGCDPRPSTPGDRIAFFDGFDAPLTGRWTAVGDGIGAWTVSGGMLTFDGDADFSDDIGYLFSTLPNPARYRILAAFDPLTGTGDTESFGVIANSATVAIDTNVRFCGLAYGGSFESDRVVAADLGAGGEILASADVELPLTPMRVEATQIAASDYVCSMWLDPATSAVNTPVVPVAGTRWGFRVRNLSVNMTYVVLFEIS